jgi:hypothetical protein
MLRRGFQPMTLAKWRSGGIPVSLIPCVIIAQSNQQPVSVVRGLAMVALLGCVIAVAAVLFVVLRRKRQEPRGFDVLPPSEKRGK